MVYKCKICAVEIHPKRVQLGYRDSCVNHSTVNKYSAFIVSEGTDVDNLVSSVQVIKDYTVAESLMKLNKKTLQ